jgi:hypothetical protein
MALWVRLPAETREFRQNGVCETAETSFAKPFRRHISYDIHIVSAADFFIIEIKKITFFFVGCRA